LGISWERDENTLGTKKKTKKSLSLPLLALMSQGGYNSSPGQPYEHRAGWKHKLPTICPQKEKSWTTHECMLTLLDGCMKHLIPKLFVTIF